MGSICSAADGETGTSCPEQHLYISFIHLTSFDYLLFLGTVNVIQCTGLTTEWYKTILIKKIFQSTMCVRQISEHNVIRVLIKVWKNCSVTMRLEAAHSTYQEGSEMEWSESPKRSRVHQEACGPRGRTGKGMRRMKGAGLPRWQNGKEPAYQCRRHRRCRFDPWVGKIPWRRAW